MTVVFLIKGVLVQPNLRNKDFLFLQYVKFIKLSKQNVNEAYQ